MAKKFTFGFWNYLPLEECKVEYVDDWAECGMTIPISPTMEFGKNDPRELIPYLDRALEKGIKLTVSIRNLGFDTYIKEGAAEFERKFIAIHECLKGHPALDGYVIGDEPNSPEAFEASKQCIKIQKKIAPETNPYLNFSGPFSKIYGLDYFGGITFQEWLPKVVEETGHNVFCFDEYCQMIRNKEGYDGFFNTVKIMTEAAEAAGVDMSACLLSSAHHVFNQPTEAEYRWQINIAAALGCRGVYWFRLYDRVIGPDLYGSPIDEYGNKADGFYALLRTQKRFSDHYGEIMMRLKRKNSWIVGDPRGDYPVFKHGDHDLILNAKIDDTGVLSIFEDENGTEYLCIVNGCTKYFASFTVEFDASKCTLTELHQNGKTEIPFGSDNFGLGASTNNFGVYPAQLRLFRIDRI